VAAGLLVAACGGGQGTVAQQDPARAGQVPASDAGSPTGPKAAPAAVIPAAPAASGGTTRHHATAHTPTAVRPAPRAKEAARSTTAAAAPAGTGSAADRALYATKDGATDVGVTKDEIRLGAINMHGMALGTVLIQPIVRGVQAAYSSINDRGGVAGRHLLLVDCDDGPGEVSRAKACI
jgi:hypothetical protein